MAAATGRGNSDTCNLSWPLSRERLPYSPSGATCAPYQVPIESRGGAAGGLYLNRPPFRRPAGNCQTTQTIPVAALHRREPTAVTAPDAVHGTPNGLQWPP